MHRFVEGLVRSEAVYIYRAAVSGDIDFAVGDNGQIEFVVKKEDVPLIAVPEKAEEVVAMTVGLESRSVIGAQNALDDSTVGVAI